MYFFIEKYKIFHQMVTFPWKELPDIHIFPTMKNQNTSVHNNPDSTSSLNFVKEYWLRDCIEYEVQNSIRLRSSVLVNEN